MIFGIKIFIITIIVTIKVVIPITGPIDLKTDPLLFVKTFKFQACRAKGLFFDTANP